MKKMHEEMESVAQGDLLIIRVDSIPDEAVQVEKDHDNGVIVAHSETGHHHVLERGMVYKMPSTGQLWAEVKDRAAELRHYRSYSTHETIELPPGNYILVRQREWTPDGWRRVQD